MWPSWKTIFLKRTQQSSEAKTCLERQCVWSKMNEEKHHRRLELVYGQSLSVLVRHQNVQFCAG